MQLFDLQLSDSTLRSLIRTYENVKLATDPYQPRAVFQENV